MREIKFRALVRYKNKEATWIYYKPLTIPHAFLDEQYPNDRPEIIVKNLEWTTLKDKNEKEIYEGDICRGYGFYNEPNEYHKDFQIGVVKYDHWSFKCENINKQCRGGEVNITWKLEVIGNIYENPELITQ